MTEAGGGAHQPLDDILVAVSGRLDECFTRAAFFSVVVEPPVQTKIAVWRFPDVLRLL